LAKGRTANWSLELENTAPRIKSEYKPVDEDLIQGQKRKQWRRERRLKRIITVIVGYATIAWMIYLIIVTARTVPQIWDPYNILGISRVRKIINGLVFAFPNIF
jgi:translocation protein SEC63